MTKHTPKTPNQVRERTIAKLRAAYKLLILDGSDVARRNARLEIHALQDLGGSYGDMLCICMLIYSSAPHSRNRTPTQSNHDDYCYTSIMHAPTRRVVRPAGGALRSLHGRLGGARVGRAARRVAAQGEFYIHYMSFMFNIHMYMFNILGVCPSLLVSLWVPCLAGQGSGEEQRAPNGCPRHVRGLDGCVNVCVYR